MGFVSREVQSVTVTCSTLDVRISSIISVAVTGLVIVVGVVVVVVKDSMMVAVVDVVVVELRVTYMVVGTGV